MHLTHAEARALGLGHLIDDPPPDPALTRAQARALGSGHLIDEAPPAPAAARPARPPDGMNRLERAFAATLEVAASAGLITGWLREPLRFRLAGRCWYLPDFLVVTARSVPPTLVEVKGGYVREDAIIKLKVAAATYPCFAWLIVYRDKGRPWRAYEVNGRGIGANPIRVPWIFG